MPFWRTYYHLVWATANREPLITSEVEPRLYAYLVRKSAQLGVIVYAINGWCDHVHLVVSIPPKLAVAEVVKNLKGASSHDLNQTGKLDCTFAWQRGYGVLTLGEHQKADAESYVRDQKNHHKELTFNQWLEYSPEVDEGPNQIGLQTDGIPQILEERASYETLEELPY